MSGIKVQDVAYVRFAAPELEVMERFLGDFGFVVNARGEDVLYSRGTDPSPYLHVTERGEAGFRGVAFEAASCIAIIKTCPRDAAIPMNK